MKIKIDEWLITGKHGDWTVRKKTEERPSDNKEKQEDQEDKYGSAHYFGRLHQVLIFILNQRLSESEATNTKELLTAIRTETASLKEAVGDIDNLLKAAVNNV